MKSSAITCAVVLALFVSGTPLGAQDGEGRLTTRNPLDVIRDELVQVLDEASVPFDPAQEAAIILVLEESRQASEQLFGNVMNFSGGPPQGDEVERAMAGIEWMNNEFRQRVRAYLTAEQLEVWDAHLSSTAVELESGAPTAGSSRVQQIRINNNAFTAENGNGGSFNSGGGVQAQVIQRGGAGGWHGNARFQLRDSALNARNPFASNKPSYQQRDLDASFSGPLVRNRLTAGVNFGHTVSDNADTVNAETPGSPVQFGFTRNQSSRSIGADGIVQLTGNQSLHFDTFRGTSENINDGFGGITLPERAVDSTSSRYNIRLRHVWFASPRLVQDVSFTLQSNSDESIPRTTGVAINVPGSFNGGGGDRSTNRSLTHQFSGLWIYTGERYAIRTGGSAVRRYLDRTDEDNFQGRFTFPDLDAFIAGTPSIYTITIGDPSLDYSQVEWNTFVQFEQNLTNRFTVFYGARYERQTGLADGNNIDPRISVAYGVGPSTVIRGGVGIFHQRIQNNVEFDLLRLDGTRQAEIVVENPGYPDPFETGPGIASPPESRRVRAADVVAPYEVDTSVQIEHNFPANLFVTAAFDYQRGFHRLRSRNLNAPFPGETERPNPAEGNVWQFESSGMQTQKSFRLGMRQRFSVFRVNANYSYQVNATDTTGNFSAPSNNYDLSADWASVGDHNFSTSINSELPFDVYLTSDISFRSGNTYTITTGRDDNGDGVLNDRPPGVPRNSERGPYRQNVSFNISKAFPLSAGGTGGANVNVYANMNNAFNRTNLGTPIGNLSSSRFGQYVSAFSPREITAGMRFSF